MGRLIEVQDTGSCPSTLVIQSGDMLLFRATGGRVRSGGDIVEFLGPFLTAVVADNGTVLAPQGAPNTALFHARGPGRASIEVIQGDPWHGPHAAVIDLAVEP